MSDEKANNFDALRLIAALTVLASHAFPLSGDNRAEPILWLSGGQVSGGALAVTIFFVISGYLITRSFERGGSPATYVTNRALRLLPALVVALVLLSFVIGPVISSVSLSAYFRASGTYRFTYQTMSFIDFCPFLPGVFAHNPFRNVVDGSLWTLHFEVGCYVLVAVLGLFRLLDRYVSAGLLVLFWLLLIRYRIASSGGQFDADFLAGMALYLWRVPLRADLALLCAVLLGMSLMIGGMWLASASVGAYLVIFVALSPAIRLPNLARWGDLSYGVYIWGFPVQQLIAQLLGRHVTWYAEAALPAPIVIGLAWLSWHLVEAPALALKRRRAFRPATVGGLGD